MKRYLSIRRHSQLGFSLIEVIVSLMIFAGVFASIVSIFSDGLTRSRILQEQSHALILAESKMDEIIISEDIDDLELEGSFGGTSYRFLINKDLYELEGANNNYDLFDITLTVSSPEEPNLARLKYLKGTPKSQ